MKRLFLVALLSVAAFCASAQINIETKKYRIADFHEKTMEVVLTGNSMLDAELRDAMNKVWHISAYEMCTVEQMEAKKTSKDYYFLIATDTRMKKEAEAGLVALTIYKGDPQAKEDLGKMLELVSIPFCSTGNTDGDEALVLPALLTILQANVENIVDKDIIAAKTVSPESSKALKSWEQKIVMDRDDLGFSLTPEMEAEYSAKGISFLEEGDAASCIEGRTEGTLATYLVAPEEDTAGRNCYIMLIDCSTWELYYIKKHNVSPQKPSGITQSDLSAMAKHKKATAAGK